MANMTFKANLLPSSNLGYNLGSSDKKWNVYGILKGEAEGYLPLTGGTMTGQLIMTGTAASNPIITRGITGSDGNGAIGDLYLNYNEGKVYLSNNGKIYADNGTLSATTFNGTLSGNAATATKIAYPA